MKSPIRNNYSLLLATIISLFSQLNNCSTYYFHNISSNDILTDQVGSFLNHVLILKTDGLLNKLLKDINNHNTASFNDALYYSLLQDKRDQLNPHYSLYYQYRLLKHQTTILGKQIDTLLQTKTVGNILEIGSTGTYTAAILPYLDHYNKIYALNDKKKYTDHIQGFHYNPFKKFLVYDQFIPLCNYRPIPSTEINDNSIDLCICLIGLHHIQEETLNEFVASIARVLSPGGIFILREHDTKNEDIKAIAYAAHSLFNILVPNESLETELNEYRNFQPLEYWIELLKKHGLEVSHERLLQDGDPTLNTMIKFTKTITKTDLQKNSSLQALDKKTEKREPAQTYLTTTEWYNVDVSEKYAAFINHTPFFQFPYVESILTYWKLYIASTRAGIKKQGFIKTTISEYNMMNLFIGTTMTVEYLLKSLISLPVRLMYEDATPGKIQLVIEDPENIATTLDSRIQIIEKDTTTHFVLIEIPRYKEFLSIINTIASNSINIITIAGNKEIAFKVRYKKNNNTVTELTDHFCEYAWSMPTEPEYTYALLTVQTNKIKSTLELLKQNNIELLYIHDF